MFPCLPARNICCGHKKCFRNILCPQEMFPSLLSPRNIMGNKASATMCPHLPGPLECLRLLCQYFNAKFPLFHNLAIFFLGNYNFLWSIDNNTSYCPIQSVIILVILNRSDDPATGVPFCYHSYHNRPQSVLLLLLIFFFRGSLFRRALDAEMKDTTSHVLYLKYKKEEKDVKKKGRRYSEVFIYWVFIEHCLFLQWQTFWLREGEHRNLVANNLEIGSNFVKFQETSCKTLYGGLNDLKYIPKVVKRIAFVTNAISDTFSIGKEPATCRGWKITKLPRKTATWNFVSHVISSCFLKHDFLAGFFNFYFYRFLSWEV